MSKGKQRAKHAYFSESQEEILRKKGYESRIIKKTESPEHSAISREMYRRAKIRKRVEHVFGFIQNFMHGKFIKKPLA